MIKAIILAAGRGSRMKNLTLTQPKCLLKINGLSILDMQINSLKKSDIHEIGLVVGYKNEAFQKYTLKKFKNTLWDKSNIFQSLTCADEWLQNFTCIVSYGDIFYEKTAINSLLNSNDDISLTYDTNWKSLWKKRFSDPLMDAETFMINSDYYVTNIGKKTNKFTLIQGQYMGLLKLEPSGWNNLKKIFYSFNPNDRRKFDMTAILDLAIKEKIKIKAIPFNGNWGEVDSETDLRLYKKLIK